MEQCGSKQTKMDRSGSNGLKCYADITQLEYKNNKYYALTFRYFIIMASIYLSIEPPLQYRHCNRVNLVIHVILFDKLLHGPMSFLNLILNC